MGVSYLARETSVELGWCGGRDVFRVGVVPNRLNSRTPTRLGPQPSAFNQAGQPPQV